MQADVMTRQVAPVTLTDSRAVKFLELVVKWEVVRVVVSFTGTVTVSVQFCPLPPFNPTERKIVIATATIPPAFIVRNALEVGGVRFLGVARPALGMANKSRTGLNY
jgi:hypothetical protein